MSNLRERAVALYKPPFKFFGGYIWDSEGQMVADNHVDEDAQILRVRGWGRISYLENPEELQDEVGELIHHPCYIDSQIAVSFTQVGHGECEENKAQQQDRIE